MSPRSFVGHPAAATFVKFAAIIEIVRRTKKTPNSYALPILRTRVRARTYATKRRLIIQLIARLACSLSSFFECVR